MIFKAIKRVKHLFLQNFTLASIWKLKLMVIFKEFKNIGTAYQIALDNCFSLMESF